MNKARNLRVFLKDHLGHMLVEYPEYDMVSLKLHDHKFDLVIHSETLEHNSDPQQGLETQIRVLKKEGKLFFSIPKIFDRITRFRKGMAYIIMAPQIAIKLIIGFTLKLVGKEKISI